MAALLDLHPEPIHPVLAGTKEIEAVLDQLLPGPDTVSGTVPDMVLGTHDYTAAVTALERVSRRLDAVEAEAGRRRRHCLCHQHHQWIHDTTYHHQPMPDGSLRFSRRT